MANFGGINAATSALSSVYAPTRVTVDWGDGQTLMNPGMNPGPQQFPGWGGPPGALQGPMPPGAMQPPGQGSSIMAQIMNSLLPMIMQLVAALKNPPPSTQPPTTVTPPPTHPNPTNPGPTNPGKGWALADFNDAIVYADADKNGIASIDELYDLANNGVQPADVDLTDTSQSRQQISFARQAATAILREYDFFQDPAAELAQDGVTKADVARVARRDGNAQNLTVYELHGVDDPAAEDSAISQWLDAYELNEYGDSTDTNYPGGNPMFDESLGMNTFINARDYLLYQYPDRPWNDEFGPDLPVDDATPPPDDTVTPPDDELDIPPDLFI